MFQTSISSIIYPCCHRITDQLLRFILSFFSSPLIPVSSVLPYEPSGFFIWFPYFLPVCIFQLTAPLSAVKLIEYLCSVCAFFFSYLILQIQRFFLVYAFWLIVWGLLNFMMAFFGFYALAIFWLFAFPIINHIIA